MTPTLSSPGVLQVVIMITCGAHSDDEVGIVTTVDFRYYAHDPVNMKIILATIIGIFFFFALPCFTLVRVTESF